jgi:hypothetical protein
VLHKVIAVSVAIPFIVGAIGCGTDSADVSEAKPRQLLVRSAVLPKEWKEAPPTHGRACSYHPRPQRVVSTHLAGGLADIQQRVIVFGSPEAAEEAYRELVSKRGENCFRGIVQEETVARGGPLMKRLTVLEMASGANTQERQMFLTVNSPIGPANVYVNDLKGQAGRMLTTLRFSSGLSPFPENLYEQLKAGVEESLRHADSEDS